jgi:hypothetical protein
MRHWMILIALGLNTLAGCAALNRRPVTAVDGTTSGRPAYLTLEAEGTDPWVVFICRPDETCAFFGLFRSGQAARVRWRDGDFMVVADGTEAVRTPDAEGYITDDQRCTRRFVGEAQVTTNAQNGSLLVTRHLRHVATPRNECLKRYTLAEEGRNVTPFF